MKNKGGFDIDESLLMPEGDVAPVGIVTNNIEPPKSRHQKEPETRDLLEILANEKRVLYHDDIMDLTARMGLDPKNTKKVLSGLVDKHQVTKARIGHKLVYWASQYKFIASPYLAGNILVLDMQVSEGKAWKSARRTLPGLFHKDGDLALPPVLQYLPIFKVDIEISVKAHWYSSEQQAKDESIYLDGYKGRICRLHPRKGLTMELVTQDRPDRISDFDDYGHIQDLRPGSLKIDYNLLKKILSKKDVIELIHRKFITIPKNIDILLFPYWKFTVKTTENTRVIYIDALFGHGMDWG